MTENPSISIIVPILNEEGSLDKFYIETKTSLNEYSNWELIFIDDGSDDDSN
ncbi:MAG TPA: glycosyltransferase, partial [Candidatus Marinimicrobia bacterium]|nr:glycosyltransferase [Candidatus Neomarinimicrobiota bacterium]